MLAGKKNSVVLDAGRDYVIAGFHQTRDGEIVGFCPATGKDDLRRSASDQRCHGCASTLDRRSRVLTVLMDRRGVTEALPKVWTHGIEHVRQNRRGRVVVEVNPA